MPDSPLTPGWHDDPWCVGRFRYRTVSDWTPHVGTYEPSEGVPSWSADPAGQGLRYWSGSRWTDMRIDANGDPTVFEDPRGEPTGDAPWPAGADAAEAVGPRPARRPRPAPVGWTAAVGVLVVLVVLVLWALRPDSPAPDSPAPDSPVPDRSRPVDAELRDGCMRAVGPQLRSDTGLDEDPVWESVRVVSGDDSAEVTGTARWGSDGEATTTAFTCRFDLDGDATPTLSEVELVDGP